MGDPMERMAALRTFQESVRPKATGNGAYAEDLFRQAAERLKSEGMTGDDKALRGALIAMLDRLADQWAYWRPNVGSEGERVLGGAVSNTIAVARAVLADTESAEVSR